MHWLALSGEVTAFMGPLWLSVMQDAEEVVFVDCHHLGWTQGAHQCQQKLTAKHSERSVAQEPVNSFCEMPLRRDHSLSPLYPDGTGKALARQGDQLSAA